MSQLVRRNVTAALFMAWVTLFAGRAMAQDVGSTVSGRLLDPNNDVVTGILSTVTLRNAATGQAVTGTVTDTGDYSLSNVPAGIYDVSVPIPCCMYTAFTQKAVTVKEGEKLSLDLHVGWGMNLGTIGDDPGQLSADLRRGTRNINGKPPRMPNGKPDLSGMWVNINAAGGTTRAPPLQPWAREMLMKMMKSGVDLNAGAYCLPQSALPNTLPFPYKFVQTPTLIVQISEFVTPAHRQIFLDGRKHPDLNSWNPAWYGHSIAHWEKDTLVVDTIGFNEITPGFGIHSEKLHVVERITRPVRGRLDFEITAEDPDAFTGPFTFKLSAGLVEGDEIEEFVCVENNKDPTHLGGLGWKGRL